MKRRDERGYASILVLGFTLVAIAVTGLAVDGTRAFLFRRSLQNAADAAALAAASEIDRSAYYSSGGGAVAIDPERARATAEQWLARRAIGVRAGVTATERNVQVVLRGELEMTFLRVLGIDSAPVAAESTAEPRPGSP